jgi:phosphatidate cytidylyltransferase
LGILIVAALVGLCWLDHWLYQVLAIPGIALFPVAVLFVLLASEEMLSLAAASGMRPLRWVVYGGNLLVVAGSWIPFLFCKVHEMLCPGSADPGLPNPGPASVCTMLALAMALVIVFIGEMRRYERPDGVTANMAVEAFAIVYVGFLLGFLVQLRSIWGIGALASLLIVVKMGDTGAYTVGRLVGRIKLVPALSPGKTIEGAIGGIVFACAASWAIWLVWVATAEDTLPGRWWRWILFGFLVAIAGIAGDLAESLIKRDAQRKDSGHWLPGLGGVLDMLDSVLVAAPVGYGCWAFGLVGQ